MFGRKKTIEKPKPAKRPKRRDVTYRLSPTDYVILPPERKDEVLENFVRMLKASEKKLRISIVNRGVTAEVVGKEMTYVEKTVYLTSKFDMGSSIASNGFFATRLDEPLEFPIRTEKLNCLEMQDGTFQKAYTIFQYSRSISPAWINVLASMASMVHIDIIPLTPSAAKRSLITHANTLEGKRGQRYHDEAADARYVNDMLAKQETSLYEVRIAAIVSAPDMKELKARCKEFERNARWRQIRYLSVAGKQRETQAGWGAKFLYDLRSLATFYPFESSDLIEADGAGGVYLGRNEMNGTPIVYDYLNRTNYNMLVLGASGSGKSVTIKTYLDNFLAMMRHKYGKQDMMSAIFDTHGEYVSMAERFGMNVVNLMDREEIGVDPFKLLKKKSDAVNILAEISKMPANMRSICMARSDGIGSTEELVKRLYDEDSVDKEDCRQAATYLASYTKGDMARVFRGEMQMKKNSIIYFREADHRNVNDCMLISLVLQKVWNEMREAPKEMPKLLVIEEAWFMLKIEATTEILLDIIKSGRKENVHLMVVTQEIDDVLKNPHASALINNCDTLIALRMQSHSAGQLKKVAKLSDTEMGEIPRLDKGQLILRATNTMIKMKVKPTEEQMKTFSTTTTRLG